MKHQPHHKAPLAPGLAFAALRVQSDSPDAYPVVPATAIAVLRAIVTLHPKPATPLDITLCTGIAPNRVNEALQILPGLLAIHAPQTISITRLRPHRSAFYAYSLSPHL